MDRLCAGSTILQSTGWRTVDLTDEAAVEAATAWWEQLTASGGEGLGVKPASGLPVDAEGRLIQPAIKVRGAEYLRIIYGPEYQLPANLERLRRRGVSRKRSLARRQLALGLEGLALFAERAPLDRVFQCAFGVLALSSVPVDPRL